ncbi:L-threonylcarbamoyladenylate synthase [Fructilactobacillus florum]|uniref:Threonylcarbamoyl-AMP synthase n=1 Tax=Fructilactobacillus florum DSM 22689 = JCM 16035 TaxID=1423745 RepID=A0A0R2CLL9_9LACO|nr:L-threonylcarbamoyladenylate synthase [Fructilactobacillus florum]KRM92465.1 hypothetical protein FC87_GL000077 [Fructilactobacillus florum DSM 22689 = JCM 16035]
METKIYTAQELSAAAAQLRAGELVAFPTETVYGLGADATNTAAVKKVYQAKGRPSDNPLIVHVADVKTVTQYAATLTPTVKKLMDQFWPGPLTIILKLKPQALAGVVTGGLSTAAFRNPRQPMTNALIKAAGFPLVGPSANTSGKPSPTTAAHVYHDLHGKIAGILDAGPTEVGVESTVLDMSAKTPTILRPGAVTRADLLPLLGEVLEQQPLVGKTEIPKAPGMKYTHYSPAAAVQIVDDDQQWTPATAWIATQSDPVGVLATEQQINMRKWPKNAHVISLGTDINTASQRLFAGLRQFDLQPEIKHILVTAFPRTGLGDAYMNRLEKAAGQKHFISL